MSDLSRRNVIRLGVLGVGAVGLSKRALANTPIGVHSSEMATRLAKDRLRSFLALSEVLTGVAHLDSGLALQYLNRFAENPMVGPFLPDLLEAYNSVRLESSGDQVAALKSRIWDNAALRPAAEQLVYLWYISAFAFRDQTNPNKVIWQYGTEEQYNQALIWKVIRGHPPMTTPSTWTAVP